MMDPRKQVDDSLSRTFERGWTSTLNLSWPKASAEPQIFDVHGAEFLGWREEALDGSATSSSGRPPENWRLGDWRDNLAGPSDRLQCKEAGSALRLLLDAFARAIGVPMTLRYSRLQSRRFIRTELGAWRWRDSDVFALTGRIHLASGSMMSLGWSGAGDGSDRLGDGPLRQRLSWIVRTAGQATRLEPGTPPAVLLPQPAALVAHEAIGHFCEASADPAISLVHRLGCRLAGDDFDAYDDPTREGAVRYDLDDEGTEAIGATKVLSQGLVVQQLHSRRSAKASGTLPTGNARSAQVSLPPIPRLSNLVISEGEATNDELIEAMGTGLLVHHLSHGFSRGIDVEARIVLAEHVVRGRRTGRYVTGGSVRERIDLLTRCSARANRTELNPNSLCGKCGQILYDVGTFAPAMLLSSLRMSA